jgi:hypothetical protein
MLKKVLNVSVVVLHFPGIQARKRNAHLVVSLVQWVLVGV